MDIRWQSRQNFADADYRDSINVCVCIQLAVVVCEITRAEIPSLPKIDISFEPK